MAKARKAGEADQWMSLNEAAKALGVVRQTLLTRAVKAEITAKHVAGRTVILRADVERLKKAG